MTHHRVVITRRLTSPAVDSLRAFAEVWMPENDDILGREELLSAVDGATVIVCVLTDRIDEETIRAAGPQLGLVATISAGFDHLDRDALRRHKVQASHTPGVLTEATAELTIALMLAATRRIAEGDRLIREGRTWRWDLEFMLGPGLTGSTLGIVGLGQIGRAVARRAHAFGMRVIATPPSGRQSQTVLNPEIDRVLLDDLLAESDVVSIHCPLTEQTHHLFDDRRLRQMKSTATLVNTARGPIVDEAALVHALERGVISAAALDVYEDEPAVHPGLRALDSVVLVPHLGSATVATRTAMIEMSLANALTYVQRRRVLNPVLSKPHRRPSGEEID